MCHPVLFGFFIGLLAARIARRAAWRHGGCGGSSYGGGGRRFGRWAQLRDHLGSSWGWGFYHRGPFSRSPFGGPFHRAPFGGVGATRPLGELVRGLDLNQRQQEEAQPVFARLTERLGTTGPHIEAALSAVAADRFERDRIEPLLFSLPPELRRELLDGLEHVHNILIPEQRAHLREVLLGGPADSSGSSSSGVRL